MIMIYFYLFLKIWFTILVSMIFGGTFGYIFSDTYKWKRTFEAIVILGFLGIGFSAFVTLIGIIWSVQ